MMTSFEKRVNFLRLSSENGKKPLPGVTLGAVNRNGIERHPTLFSYLGTATHDRVHIAHVDENALVDYGAAEEVVT